MQRAGLLGRERAPASANPSDSSRRVRSRTVARGCDTGVARPAREDFCVRSPPDTSQAAQELVAASRAGPSAGRLRPVSLPPKLFLECISDTAKRSSQAAPSRLSKDGRCLLREALPAQYHSWHLPPCRSETSPCGFCARLHNTMPRQPADRARLPRCPARSMQRQAAAGGSPPRNVLEQVPLHAGAAWAEPRQSSPPESGYLEPLGALMTRERGGHAEIGTRFLPGLHVLQRETV